MASPSEMTEYFVFLDELRTSGVTNMYGAAPYLSVQFILGKDDAREILHAWTSTFDGKSTAEACRPRRSLRRSQGGLTCPLPQSAFASLPALFGG